MKIFSDLCIPVAAGFSLRRILLPSIIALFAAGASAQGFLDLPPGTWWKNEEVIQALGLTGDQQRKLDDIMYAHLERMIDLKADFEKEELRLKQLLDLPRVEEGRLMDQVRKALGAQHAMQMDRAAMFVKVRTLLTPEQWEKIKVRFQQERRERRFQEMRDRREGRGDRPGRPEGEPAPRPEPEGVM